jgi:1-acyl-sn-glycerol-3-phosphate acyltransferase
MNSAKRGSLEVTEWDPEFTRRVMRFLRPLVKLYHRSEVRGLTHFPAGAAMVVSNHSGGMMPVDVPLFATAFYKRFGYSRPVYTLSHDMLMSLPTDYLARTGFIRATPDNAEQALRSGGVVVVFPGGDYDACRPTLRDNRIDFGGRTGYVKTAIKAGVPIVPMVGIGGQQTQLFLSRGQWLARALRIDNSISKQFPLSIGFPFGFSAGGLLPMNVPLPTKIVHQVLQSIDIAGQFGPDPDVDQVDSHVRAVMQEALDTLAEQRRFPVIG